MAVERAEKAGTGSGDVERVQKLLEDVVARAQAEVIERTRKEVELQERLKTSVEEKKFLLERLQYELDQAGERLRLRALVALPDGSRAHRAELSGPAGDGEALGQEAGRRLRAEAGAAFFAALADS